MQRKWIFRMVILVVVIGAAYRIYQSKPKLELIHLQGQTMGTIRYNVKYLSSSPQNYQAEVDSILVAFNQSLSTYITDSEISLLNKTGTVERPSAMFLEVLNKSKEVYEKTAGAFDPTVGLLVNAWGFGPNKELVVPDSVTIDSLRILTDFTQVVFGESKVEMNPAMYLDFSAIAKGYAVDLVAEFLENKGFINYMLEIGGEVRTKGMNDENGFWKIGIEDPTVSQMEQRLLAIIELQDLSMATSGNYRNYYKVGDKIIAHTIDPRTGYNTNHNLLSASIFSKDCMSADAYATAAMVLGLENTITLVESTDIEAFLIYTDQAGELKTFVSKGLQSMVALNKTETK